MSWNLKLGCKLLVALGICLLSSSCDTTKSSTARYRKFVPPPIRRAIGMEPSLADINLDAGVSAPVYNFTIPRPALPRRPSNSEFLMQRADRLFADGKKAMAEGRNRDARRSFDTAVQVLMSEPLPADPVERRRLEEHLDDMADAIYHYDLEQLGSGLPTDAQSALLPPSVEKQILEENLPVNPELRQKVREQIETTMSELPLEVTDAVLSYIDYFSTDRGRKVLLSGFARSGRYREMISRVFSEEGLPAELIHVAQLESHFNPSAVSYAAAVGMWQFVRDAGYDYHLSINSQLDERRDPERATRAAAQYLLSLYRHYGDWYLALAAYNCGPGCVDRAIQRTGYADFWELRRMKALPLATTNYVPEILAMTIMYKNAEAYGLNVEHDPALEYDNVVLDADTSLNLVAMAIDRPIGQIKQLNPALLQTVAPRGYSLHLPIGTAELVDAAFTVVPATQRKTARIHRVEDEDTWLSIAKQYNTTVAKLTSLNDEQLPAVGKFVMVPPLPAPPPPKPAAKKSSKKGASSKTSSKSSSSKSTKSAPKPQAKSKSTSKSTRKSGA